MANTIIIIIKERKPVGKHKYTRRRERLVGYGRVMLGESVVKARVKKYFLAQRTMSVTPNLLFSLEKQELEKVSFEK